MNKSTVMGSVGGLVVGVLIGSLALQSGGDQQEAGSRVRWRRSRKWLIGPCLAVSRVL